MKFNNKAFVALFAIAALGLLLAGACKSSGIALTKRGQIMNIDLQAPGTLPEGGTGEVSVKVENNGLSKLGGVMFDVEFPREVVILSESHGDGINLVEGTGPDGGRMFHYDAGNIEATTDASARFSVRTAFGSLQQSGTIRVTAWQKDLPGDKLVETKFIKMRAQ